MLDWRVLGAGDEGRFEAFLVRHRDTSMFLRSNARQVGLVYAGRRFEATYVGAFRGEDLVGVAAHAWNGLILLQAPESTGPLVQYCTERSRRPVMGFTGPLAQVREARRALGLEGAPALLQEDERLYGLDVEHLTVPVARFDEGLAVRPPRPEEVATLHAWRVAYEVECLGRNDTEELRRSAASAIDAQVADGVAWVAVASGKPVSYAAFNATLPDIVQLGGVYTPPEFRGRGYARAAVAHSVGVARARGATRAVLFTRNPNAVRTYEAVGFRCRGEYGLVLFA